jgi:hypothetical protein
MAGRNTCPDVNNSPLPISADIVRQRDTLTAVRYLVRAEIQTNKTEDEAIAEKRLAPGPRSSSTPA